MAAEQSIQLIGGGLIRVTSKEVQGTKDRITVRVPTLLKDLTVNDQIFINDGIVELVVEAVEAEDLVCRIVSGGMIASKKGCNIPSTKVHVDIMTEKDRRDLKFIAELNPEFVAASFVGSGQDIGVIRKILHEHGNQQIQIVAKIERPLALKNIEEIVRSSDVCMIARGDLAVECPTHQVPVAQKNIVRLCNLHARPVIIATQMLESMTSSSRPTRAEASDVFKWVPFSSFCLIIAGISAVLDGADAVMLSGETSVGKYPVETVRCMAQLALSAERFAAARHLDSSNLSAVEPDLDRDDFFELNETIGGAIQTLSRHFRQRAIHGKIIVLTESGFAARMVSKFRPSLPICAVVTSDRVARELAIVWGINTVQNNRLTTLFRKQKYELLLKQLCYQRVVGQHETVILVQTVGRHATISVYDVDEIMHESGHNVDNVSE